MTNLAEVAAQAAAPEAQPNIVQPAPYPITFQIMQGVAADGTPCVVLALASCTGQHISFWPPEAARALAQALTRAGSPILLA